MRQLRCTTHIGSEQSRLAHPDARRCRPIFHDRLSQQRRDHAFRLQPAHITSHGRALKLIWHSLITISKP